MAKVFTGREGRLLINGVDQIKVTSWALTGSVDVLETTGLGESQRSYTPNLQEFSGTATLLYYRDEAGRNDAATALRNVLKTEGVTEADVVTLNFRLVNGNTNSDVTFNAYITSVSYGASVGEVSSAQITFQATGALTGVTL
jgi:hypothetical protein